MPTIEEHKNRALRNERFLALFDLNKTEFTDWAVTACLYAALHWVDAYLTKIGQKQEDHFGRNAKVDSLEELAPIRRDYKKLYSDSRNARYDLVTFTCDHVREVSVVRMKRIRAYLEPRL